MKSAFGVEHEISKQQTRTVVVRPATAQERRKNRVRSGTNAAIGTGVLSGGVTMALNRGGLKPAAQAAGIGAALGGALGASSKRNKYKSEIVKVKPKQLRPLLATRNRGTERSKAWADAKLRNNKPKMAQESRTNSNVRRANYRRMLG